jgi:23S rRNA (cytosine1962-C5)-methyltransferase
VVVTAPDSAARDRLDRRALWPDLDPARIVFEDEAMIVVDKPAGVPSQQASAKGDAVADDLVERVRSFLASRERVAPERVYLGVHQRLDRATSGVVAYTRKKEANRSFAEQFEGRKVDKRYLAIVTGWPTSRAQATLRHHLAEGEDGRVDVVSQKTRGAQLAVTHVELVRHDGDRALLSLRLETGRTHQARAQLAAAGAPIAGDRWYGDAAPAPRLMLHAESITLEHPLDRGRRVTARAEMPRAFSRFLAEGDASPFAGGVIDEPALADALDTAREARFALGRAGMLDPVDPAATTAFRLVNEGGDGVPGVALDVYGDHLVAHLYDDDALSVREPLLDALDGLGFAGIYLKVRPKQANTLVDTRTEALAPKKPVRGRPAEDELSIIEHGLPYRVRLGDGLSTGIFLDQRENRRRVRALAAGKRVLNLFAYTCPFTLAAAAGGAARTVSVDAARAAIDRGRLGLEHAGLAGDHHVFVVDDVFAYVEQAKRRGELFDLVLLDPPSYSTVGASRFSADAYRPLAAKVMPLVARGGQLLACTNHRKTVRAKLRRLLHEAARDANRTVAQMKDLPPPADFPPPFGREAHLKSILVKLA